MIFHMLVLFPLLARCFGQESSCENISLGSCLVEQNSIIKTLPVPPATCDTLCEVDDNCEFWKARIDGTLCQLLLTDYQHDCESFAGHITSSLADCTDSNSCSAYVLDDCTYTGERLEDLEPAPGNVASIEECRQWAKVLVDGGLTDVAFFHFDSDIDKCHLYSIMVATCQSVGGPRTAPTYDQCSQLAN